MNLENQVKPADKETLDQEARGVRLDQQESPVEWVHRVFLVWKANQVLQVRLDHLVHLATLSLWYLIQALETECLVPWDHQDQWDHRVFLENEELLVQEVQRVEEECQESLELLVVQGDLVNLVLQENRAKMEKLEGLEGNIPKMI